MDSLPVIAGMLSVGRGVGQDWVEAYKWLSLASAHDEQGTQVGLARLKEVMTEEQINEALERAEAWSSVSEVH